MDEETVEETSTSMNGGEPKPNIAPEDTPNQEKLETDRAIEMRKRMESWLNQPMRIQMTDGRTLVGTFICTDKDRNVILGSCEEYVNPPDSPEKEEPRVLGLAMVPGQHIVSIEIDEASNSLL
ncbi:N-alpha-acetyltransferase 38, NatC auxiliary subunit [Strongylocentrotus purpuratus]|uniref:Sm domain-containing protein n=1 Tax=Strongylocentrotus purpuratus TaxID=7668 RepID=A0A7M7LL06_STRPU|nr:N-alpha-acetyltransferase 38, NatC auxiliary subunit [Strongylocentrotus purpuratus]|eukprot:XP_001198253.2 PREDICTED: N-alpha-acetyltransferase 38, NatC auxiliary subunit [Strongylocentrotus purpuratus]